MDEDWLDESLRRINLYLAMASGRRRYSYATEGVDAKMILSRERGNVIDVQLLWGSTPKYLRDLPIRHVLPQHPTAEQKGDPVLFIRGPRKGQFGTIHSADDGFVMVSELHKKKGRHSKLPKPTKHSRYNLTMCQWPKRT